MSLSRRVPVETSVAGTNSSSAALGSKAAVPNCAAGQANHDPNLPWTEIGPTRVHLAPRSCSNQFCSP